MLLKQNELPGSFINPLLKNYAKAYILNILGIIFFARTDVSLIIRE